MYDVASQSPLQEAPKLSERVGVKFLLKREDLQPIFSFKLRGAYNKIANLSSEERSQGIIAASAGNHAQGVAFSAKELGLRAVITMPVTTPQIKVKAVKNLGAEVVLFGDTYDDAALHCEKIIQRDGLVYVHPFDDSLVIAGQGTIGIEILKQSQESLGAIFVPVGGGGLIAGISAYIKSQNPNIKVIGVEPFEADAMFQSLKDGNRVHLDRVGLFVDGVAVHEVGEKTFKIAKETVDEIVRVNNDEICAAIKDVFDDTRTIMEPAGSLSVAGAKAWLNQHPEQNKPVAAILSGANMNFDRLRFVAERAELGEEREALLAVTIPERPGAFHEFCATIGKRVVTEFNYRLSGRQEAHIFVGVATTSRADAKTLISRLTKQGYATAELSENEMAKIHVRHMVGGRASGVTNERLCRFEFPERPGALMEFLESLGGRWNISLFHYRNHGADFGRVLTGFEITDDEAGAFKTFLDKLGYPYVEETSNTAYDFFLR